jgi:lipopolysaccharide export LptBFGC system permease protein LptF
VEKKAGVRVACPNCRARNKIPGIAMQSNATKEQIEQLQTALDRHRQSLWVLFIVLFLLIVLSLFSVSGSSDMGSEGGFIGAGILVGIIIAVLIPILKTCGYLGSNKAVNILLFLFLPVIWVVVCIIFYVKLKERIAILKMAGVRSDKASSGRFMGLI